MTGICGRPATRQRPRFQFTSLSLSLSHGPSAQSSNAATSASPGQLEFSTTIVYTFSSNFDVHPTFDGSQCLRAVSVRQSPFDTPTVRQVSNGAGEEAHRQVVKEVKVGMSMYTERQQQPQSDAFSSVTKVLTSSKSFQAHHGSQVREAKPTALHRRSNERHLALRITVHPSFTGPQRSTASTLDTFGCRISTLTVTLRAGGTFSD